jgi:hypothetical protein
LKSKRPKPPFQQSKPAPTYDSPEQLFYKLGREGSHNFLRGPQQDVLREYAEKFSASPDVAFELPTGTGKTTVGLLIAEWKRHQGDKVAYLSLTNQLAAQALAEGQKLGVPCADLRGKKDERDPTEEGRFRTGSAVAVTTYSNLFNVNPIIQDCEALVCDDAHGAEQYVAHMWSMRVEVLKEKALYASLLAALRPGLSKTQIESILAATGGLSPVELVDVHTHAECIPNVASVVNDAISENATSDDVFFAWKKIGTKLRSCLFLVSSAEILIRPLVPPTHTHAPFAEAKQRMYMSATLGGESDLQRTYGIGKFEMVRAKTLQWGRRYIFVPGIYTSEGRPEQVAAAVWDELDTRRAVLLAPSDRVRQRTLAAIEKPMQNKPTILGAADIADTLDPFVTKQDVILALAGRYDGLDLPDDQCRLLLMSESPAAINSLERYLSERWKMGPILRKRERTRLVQGMGRCTRNPTDFAVIVWLGQSLVNAATSSSLRKGLPEELAAELQWGIEQSALAAKNPDDLVAMILGLVTDANYRRQADAQIQQLQTAQTQTTLNDYEAGIHEVRYSRALWEDNFPEALRIAHELADKLNDPELAGYRAWWWYLGSVAARLMNNSDAERDALYRASKCGVNSGWLNRLLRERKAPIEKNLETEVNAERLWERIASDWGWAGPGFGEAMERMLHKLNDYNHAAYHEGLDILGQCFGADTARTTKAGAPDVVWSFASTSLHIAFEAKTEKKADALLYKKDLQEANGHVDWVRDQFCDAIENARIESVIVAPSPFLDKAAEPFTGTVFYIAPDAMHALAAKVAEHLHELRIKYSGREFSEANREFSAELRNRSLDINSLLKVLLANCPKKKQ